MRRTPLVLTLVLVVSCDTPSTTSVPEPRTTLASPASAEWTKDTVPLHRYLPEGMAGDFTPDTIFPFHLYWHDAGHGAVPEGVRVAVRKAAAQWASVVGRTEVLPYAFTQDFACAAHWRDGEYVIWQEYAEGDTLSGGYHLYVTSDRRILGPGQWWPPGLAYGNCVPGEGRHPVTGAPPNGSIFMSARVFELVNDRWVEALAAHEIGHTLGIGMGKRWRDGRATDSVLVNGEYRRFLLQTDSIAIARYIALAEQSDLPDPVYPWRKMPRDGHGHWHFCTLWTEDDVTDVMADINGGIVTQVSASMLQGFEINWEVFGDPDDASYWTPEPVRWNLCPEVQLNQWASGLAMDRSSDTIHVNLPDIPDLGDDIRPWTYIRQGR